MLKTYKGSTVVETAYIMPLVLFTWAVVIFALFHFHDKSVLSGAAYEAAVVGAELWNCDANDRKTEVDTYFQERILGKLLLYEGAACDVSVNEREIEIVVTTSKKRMQLRVQESAVITSPEQEIRKIQRWREESEKGIE